MKRYYPLCFAAAALGFAACNDFLDKLPDNRAEINSDAKLAELITSAYPSVSFAMLAELSSDNVTDNGDAYDVSYPQVEEAYLWKDGSYEDFDTAYALWEACYMSVASANHALQYIEEQSAARAGELAPYKAEALLCRAYAHFVLANIFCRHYSPLTSARDPGIPYVETPETTVQGNYVRGAVKDVYEKINRDIEEALPYVDDNIYTVPKYHFNRAAAYAFAARFNLYYMQDLQKTVDYATLATGNPAASLRDYSEYKAFSGLDDYANHYISPQRNCNLLLSACTSLYQRVWGPYLICTRYTHNADICNGETFWSSGFWTYSSNYAYASLFGGTVNRRCTPKLHEWFVMDDLTNETGYPYAVWCLFTTDEALLTRAEAYVHLHNYPAALDDLSYWNRSHGTATTVTMELLNRLYGPSQPYGGTKKELNPDFALERGGDQETLIHAVLHARRLETLADGLRWFDVKRYGIPLSHAVYNGLSRTFIELPGDDERRAIEIPAAVVAAGMPSNRNGK
jgi:hypothetical protein